MIGARFDTWTRRRFGLATGGALAAALGVATSDAVEGRRKKRKKRCRKLHQVCRRLDGTEKRCCSPMTCIDETATSGEAACCRSFRAPCASESQCCATFKCQQAVGLRGNRCCAPLGIGGCTEDSDCCAGEGVICDTTRFECCRRVQAACAAQAECCGDLLCENVPALGGLHCCADYGDECEVDEDCCIGMGCFEGSCNT